MSVTRSELTERLAATTGIRVEEAATVMAAVLDTISAGLADGDRIELRGFGIFSPVRRAGRLGHNPRTGEAVSIPASMTVRFKAGRAVRRLLNDDPEELQAHQEMREAQHRRRDERSGQLKLL